MNRITNVLSYLAVQAGIGAALIVGTGLVFTWATGELTWYEYGQISVTMIGLASFVGALFFASWLITWARDRMIECWLDPESPMHSRMEDYMWDHAMKIDTIEQWSCGQRTLLHDLQFANYLTRRWLFRVRYDLWESVSSKLARRMEQEVRALLSR